MRNERAVSAGSGMGRLTLAGLLAVILLAGCCLSLAQSAPRIVADGAKWEELSKVGLAWGEGVVAAKDGSIYLTDMTYSGMVKENNPRGTIYRYDPKTGVTTKYMEPSGMANGLHVDKNGDLLIAQDADFGGRAVVRRNLKTGETKTIASTYEGKHLNGVNDLTSDAKGRIYFTDARYRGAEPPELPNAVYRLDPNGKLTQISTDIFRPNGIEVSPDGKKLYVLACNLKQLPTNPNGPAADKFGIPTGGAVAYDLDKNGNISNPKEVFRTKPDITSDGSAMDTDGNLYLALHNGNGRAPNTRIAVVSPDGQVQYIEGPGVGLITNLAFGRGDGANYLYVSIAEPWRLYRIKTVRKGLYWGK